MSSRGGEAPILKCPLIGWPCDEETQGVHMGDDNVARRVGWMTSRCGLEPRLVTLGLELRLVTLGLEPRLATLGLEPRLVT